MTILGLIDPIRNPQPWATLAACGAKDVEPELFFPRSNESSVVAKLICAGCPVRKICLADAVSNKQAGIRGGSPRTNAGGCGWGSCPTCLQ
jgi:WhiB family redox-sensing transcriptional regulator